MRGLIVLFLLVACCRGSIESRISPGLGVVDAPSHGDSFSETSFVFVQGRYQFPDTDIEITINGELAGKARTSKKGGPGGFAFDIGVVPPEGVSIIRVTATDPAGGVLARSYLSGETEETDSGTWLARALDVADNPLTRPPFLTEQPVLSPEEQSEYYAAIGAPATIADFRDEFGFDGTEPRFVYRNDGDLAVGRGMSCEVNGEGVTVCISENYGAFSGDPEENLRLAAAGESPFAYVNMVARPGAEVAFYVYGGDGNLLVDAALDTFGDNPSVPANCLNCHGINARYDAQTNTVTGARFLPFDPDAFGGELDLALLKELNDIVAPLSTDAWREVLDAWGPGLETDSVPVGWAGSTADRNLYRDVVAPYCRGCHAASDRADLSFATAEQFRAAAPLIVREVCNELRMPAAQVTARGFWGSGARAHLAEYLGLEECGP